jgi:hypothetical protein
MAKKLEIKGDYRVKPTSGWAGAWKIFAGLGVVGLGAAGFGYTQDPKRFAFSYLFGLYVFLAIGLGSLFFVIIQYLTKAGWSVTVRRPAEFLMSGLPAVGALALPILILMGGLFPWTHEHAHGGGGGGGHTSIAIVSDAHAQHAPAPHHGQADKETAKHAGQSGTPDEHQKALLKAAKEAEHAHILKEKKPYLNKTFFIIRMAGYLLIWFWLATRLFKLSVDQDKSKKLELTAEAQKFAPIAVILFALSLTFAAFDWLMSLDPLWYSTIFGVYIFACSVVSSLATLIIFTLLMKRSGLVGDEINTEHYHDLGKLLFGFLVFWAYISFSQFFLIWYGNIPEELSFYHRRWTDGAGSWQTLSISLVVVHFAVPFWLLMSRNIKRRVGILAGGAVILLVMHIVEMYWIVLPNYVSDAAIKEAAQRGVDASGVFAFHWMDLACLLGVGGVYFAFVLRNMAKHPVIPIGDPRLIRALKFENV